ncbi:MAG: DUF1217 domain-containing protein [Janthinobacterium lividum]
MYLNANMLSLLPNPSGTAGSLLGALYGTGAASGSVNPIAALQTALSTETKGVAAAAVVPQTKQEIAPFRAAVAKAKTPQELLANPQARKVLLTANGLGSQTDYAGLVTKALMSDTSKTGSLASTLTNTQWLSVAKTFDFANKGLTVLQSPSVIDSIASGYAEVQWRQGLDATTPGLSKAIDFRARASTITSADQVLGDATLREVVTTALGIPPQIAYQSLQAQEAAITSHIDLKKFSSPAFVDQFTRRYLIAAGSAASSGGLSGLLA